MHRRTLAAAAALAVTAALAPVSSPAQADEGRLVPVAGTPAGDAAEATLARAVRILDPTPGRRAPAVEREQATTVMRDLFASLPDLAGEDRVLAQTILARPTDGGADPQGSGYSTRPVKKCRSRVCLHYVRTTDDRPPSEAWAKKSLAMLSRVYRFEVDELGYRRPVADRRHGGNARFDVYLKDLGTGLYGYCVPEYYKPGSDQVASGYCVIDNDFSPTQFSGRPVDNLRVTLAHEFFHAVQFAYDFTDDPWLMESTAVWMEERFADAVNDNRQYLPYGQVRLAHIPLDTFADPGVHYGNWVWWEYLSRRFGDDVVRRVWSQADANEGRPDLYSTRALQKVLKRHGGLTEVFTAYAAANTVPAKNYAEGKDWPSAVMRGHRVLRRSDRRTTFKVAVDHLSSASFTARPDSSLGRAWRLRVKVEGPRRAATSGAYVVVKRANGRLVRTPVRLSRAGSGTVTVGFSRQQVRRVIVTVANASARFRCHRGTTYSCRGTAKDDGRRFRVTATAYRR